jgi:hypothetical protein
VCRRRKKEADTKRTGDEGGEKREKREKRGSDPPTHLLTCTCNREDVYHGEEGGRIKREGRGPGRRPSATSSYSRMPARDWGRP